MNHEADIKLRYTVRFRVEVRVCSFGEGRIKTVAGESRSLSYYR